MPISNSDQLFRLIKSLTKSEKRNFKLYVKRIQKGENSLKFLDLFEILDRLDAYDETLIQEKLQEENKLANLKRHLYQHLLTSLRLLHIHKEVSIQVREEIDYAHILYGKGFYLEALKLLDRAKRHTRVNNLDLLYLEIVEFEKRIESRHITRSSTERMENLMEESTQQNRILSNISALSNLKLMLQRYFINFGHVKNEKEYKQVMYSFKHLLPKQLQDNTSFFEKVYHYECTYWYHYLLLELDHCHQYAQKWVYLYQEFPNMIEEDIDMFLRGNHHLLTTSWFNKDVDCFGKTLSNLKFYVDQNIDRLSPNSSLLARYYLTQWNLNQYFTLTSANQALAHLPYVLDEIDSFKNKMDTHKIFVLYYKVACLYALNGKGEIALGYLYDIISQASGHLREDIQGYARLMLLICQYDLEQFDRMDAIVRSTQRFIRKMKEPSRLQEVTIQFFRELIKDPLDRTAPCWPNLIEKLEQLRKDPFQKRAFLYLDCYTWALDKVAKRV